MAKEPLKPVADNTIWSGVKSAWRETFMIDKIDQEEWDQRHFSDYFLGWPQGDAPARLKTMDYIIRARYLLPVLNLARSPLIFATICLLYLAQYGQEKISASNSVILSIFPGLLFDLLELLDRIVNFIAVAVLMPSAFHTILNDHLPDSQGMRIFLGVLFQFALPAAVISAGMLAPPLGIIIACIYATDIVQYGVENAVNACSGPKKPGTEIELTEVTSLIPDEDHKPGQTPEPTQYFDPLFAPQPTVHVVQASAPPAIEEGQSFYPAQ